MSTSTIVYVKVNSIIQWNCRGLKSNYNNFLLLLIQNSAVVFCLQETFLKDKDNVTFKKYNMHTKIFSGIEKSLGGVLS